jgi:archaetidylinositol phosphate synthase
MTLYKRRDKFAGFSVKVGILFSRVGLSPNQWTMISLLPIIIAVYFLMTQQFLWAALLFIISSFIDLVDGSVARVTGKVSKLGAYLDTVVDRYIEGIIIFGLLFAGLPDLWLPFYAWLFLYFFGGMMTTYAKAAAKEKELVEEELKGGLLERAERLIILFIGILLAYFDTFYLAYVIVVLAILTNITALQRIYRATRTKKKKK